MISFSRITALVLGFLLISLCFMQWVWATEPSSEEKGQVTIDWSGQANFQGLNQTGDVDLYKTHWNENSGWYLSHLTFLIKQKNGFFERVEVSARGYGSQGTVPTQTLDATLKKTGLYTFELRHRANNDIFALSDFLSGFHGTTSDRKRTQGSLTLYPIRNVQLGLRHGELNFNGTQGTTFHNPWDEFALNNQTNWRSRNYGGFAHIQGERVSLQLDHTYKTHEKDEDLSDNPNYSEGFDDTDLTVLNSYQGNNQHEGSSHHSKASFKYFGEVNVVARYARLQRNLNSTGGNLRFETTPGGAEREVQIDFTSEADRKVVGGELMGSWQFPNFPAQVRVAIRDFHESVDTRAEENEKTLIFEIPTLVSTSSQRGIDLQNTGANLALDFGPIGPWSLTVGGDLSKRSIETIKTLDGVLEEDETQQNGKALEAGVAFDQNGWKLSARQSIQDLDRDYTRRSPLDDRLFQAKAQYRSPKGWYVEGRGTRRHQANTTLEYGESPIFESTVRTAYVGGGYHAQRFSLEGGIAYVDLETQTVLLAENQEAQLAPTLLMEDFRDGNNHLDLTWRPKDGIEARLNLQYIDSSLFEAFRIEPHIRFRIKDNTWGDIGAFRYRYEETVGDRHYQTDAIMIGIGTATGSLVR